jgi:DNA polymerase III psi subunit
MAKAKQEILPSFLIESLYRNSLIMEQSSPQDNPPSNTNIEKRNILVIVNSMDKTLNEKQTLFLQSILKACKIEASKVNIITTGSPQFGDYKQLKSILGGEKCLLFGLEPSDIQLPMNFPSFQIQSYQNQQYIWAPSLEELENDKIQKIKLWNSLQKIFQIK